MLSFIIPARNESASLGRLVTEIEEVCGWNNFEHEVIIVDDGSTDATWQTIVQIAAKRPNVHGIRLRRHFGKGPALNAGFEAAKGDIIFTMDADLQDNPEDIPAFIAAIAGGLDGVVGWRKLRHDRFTKKLLSRIFNSVVSKQGLKLQDHNCGFKCFRREAIEDMNLYGEMHRYMPILAHIKGFRIGEVAVHHRGRVFGKSNYGLNRTYRGFFDLLTILFLKGFRHRPMHLLGSVGMLSLFFGMIGMAYLAGVWLVHGAIGFRPLLIYSLAALLFGCQVLATGVLAELLTAYMAKFESTYSVKNKTSALALESRPHASRGTLARHLADDVGRLPI